MLNSLAQVILKLTAPGVPDIYQGNESWNFSLVDPDNRRPVDHVALQKLAAESTGRPLVELLANWETGGIKWELTRRLLHFLEYGLTGEFHRKVYLLEREFPQPPKRFDHVYQRYYLSRSQELIVVREWWSPFEDNKLIRHKTLHTCQGTTTANAILGLEWGRF